MRTARRTDINDMEIIVRIQNGDNNPFGILYNKYRKRIYTFALAFFKDTDAAEDMVQETFIKALSSIQEGKFNEGSFINWLYTISRNLSINIYRREAKCLVERGLTHNEDNVLWEQYSATNVTPETILVEKEKSCILKNFILSMNKEYRDVLILRFYKELKYEEIAESLKVPIGTVKTRIHVATKLFRKHAKKNYAVSA
jgi:RNA polymerase sigma factor (sigma-70 family)